MIEKEVLQTLGLSSSEAKVYLALLKIGQFSSKGAILKETNTAPSKIYHVLDKLIQKGLVSTLVKRNIKHFAAAPPARLKEYLTSKKQQLAKEELLAEELLPQLESMYKTVQERVTAEIFLGWQGMETAYSTILSGLKKHQTAYILGASEGVNPEKTKRFFLKYSIKAQLKGINVRCIFNENAREYVKELEHETKSKLNKKFLFKTTPVEVSVANETSAIVMLKEEPIVILIRDKETAQSFVTYFEELWKIAKE